MVSAANQKEHAGHTIIIRYEGTAIGRIQGLDGDRNYGTTGVYEMGSIMPQENIPLRYEGQVSIDRFFVRKNDLKKLGIASVGEEILSKDILTVEVVDKYTGDIVRVYHGCTLSNYRENFRVNAIAGENATMQYLYAS